MKALLIVLALVSLCSCRVTTDFYLFGGHIGTLDIRVHEDEPKTEKHITFYPTGPIQ